MLKESREIFSTDTFLSKTKSLFDNKCTPIYWNKVIPSACYPLNDAQGETFGQKRGDFFHNFGAPQHLTIDGKMSQLGARHYFKPILENIK